VFTQQLTYFSVIVIVRHGIYTITLRPGQTFAVDTTRQCRDRPFTFLQALHYLTANGCQFLIN